MFIEGIYTLIIIRKPTSFIHLWICLQVEDVHGDFARSVYFRILLIKVADTGLVKYPMLLKTSTSHQEGGDRHWSVSTKKFTGGDGRVQKLSCVKVEIGRDDKGCMMIKDVPGSGFEIEADLVILALGFMHPEKGLISGLGVELDPRGNVKTDEHYLASVKDVFAAGDMRRGQSLIVWAISEGRRAAHSIDKYLMGSTRLPVL